MLLHSHHDSTRAWVAATQRAFLSVALPLSAYSPHTLCILSAYSPHTLCMLSVYSLHTLCILSAYSLHTLCILPAHSAYSLHTAAPAPDQAFIRSMQSMHRVCRKHFKLLTSNCCNCPFVRAWVAATQRAFLPVTLPVPVRCAAQRSPKLAEMVLTKINLARLCALQSLKGSNHRRAPIIEGLQSLRDSPTSTHRVCYRMVLVKINPVSVSVRHAIIEGLQSSKGSNHRRAPIIEGLQSSKGSNHRRTPIIEGLQSSKGSNHRRAPIIEGLQSSKGSNHRCQSPTSTHALWRTR
jgi:hypothetical protein